MQMQSKPGAAISERARQLFVDLKVLKEEYPDDAQQIAAQILHHIKGQFGNVNDLLAL